jgi:diguanylate cyclase (GGDEF)-like protein
MKLDLPTLLSTLTLTSGVLAVAVMTVAWRAKVHRGLQQWGWGLAINFLSYPAFGLRTLGWPSTSIVLANMLTALTLLLHTLALASFQRSRARPLNLWAAWIPVLLTVIGIIWFIHDDHWRNIWSSAGQLLLSCVLLSQAWAPGLQKQRLTGRWVLIAGSTLLVLTLFLRTVGMMVASDWDGHYNVPDSVQTATYLATLGVLLTNTMGFVLMQMEQALAHQQELATHDRLTGLYNRNALLDALQHYGAMSTRTHTPLAFLMIDIDHFKQVNDQFGHLVGDEVLREVANRTHARLRRADFVARFGGEEFLALLPRTDAQGAALVAEDIRRAVQELPILVKGQSLHVTVSVGVHASIVAADASATERLVSASDRALYEAKQNGRNRIAVTTVASTELCER